MLNAEREARTAANLAKLGDAVAAGRLVLPVAATFALDDVAAAFTALESGHPGGGVTDAHYGLPDVPALRSWLYQLAKEQR